MVSPGGSYLPIKPIGIKLIFPRPVISKPFRTDPVEEVIKTEGDKGIREVRDILRQFQANGEQLLKSL